MFVLYFDNKLEVLKMNLVLIHNNTLYEEHPNCILWKQPQRGGGGGNDMGEMALYEYLFKCIKSDYFISTCLMLFKIKINERVVSEQK